MNKKIFLISVLLVVIFSNMSAPNQVFAAVGNDIFNPNVNNTVLTTAIQSDGKILVGGDFSQISGTTRNRIGRLSPDGSLDGTFNPAANNAVYTITVQPDDKILVGGNFTNIAGEARERFTRLTADGETDTSFANIKVNGTIYAIVIQVDGKILIGGDFNQILIGTSNLYIREGIARLNPNGTMDTSFNPGAKPAVRALAVQQDGKILVGGGISYLAGGATSNLGRLNTDGSLDTKFTGGTDNTVNEIALHADNRIVIGGEFTKVNQITCGGIARLQPNGSLDHSMNHTFNKKDVKTVAIQPDGKIVFGGFFSTINGQPRSMLARLNFDGSLDTDFSLALGNVSQWVNTVTLQSDGKIIVGGIFTVLEGFVTNRLTRVYPDGSRESPLAPTLDFKVNAIAMHPYGSMLIGGDFTTVGGISHQGIALIGQNGLPDHTFAASVDDPGLVNAIAVQADGKILVGGDFNYMNLETLHNIGRLNPDGSLDNSFYSDINGTVYAIALQEDGKILIGGEFTTVGSTIRTYVARLNMDGSLDTGFESGVPDIVRTIALQNNGQILIGGDFTYVFSSERYYLARLNSSGTLDTSFNPNSNGVVRSIAVQPDNKILAAGDFTSLNGQSVNRIGRLNTDGVLDSSFTTGPSAGANGSVYTMALQANGKILVGGAFTTLNNAARQHIGRLHTSGGLDTSFLPGETNDSVSALALQTDGKVVAGGDFTLLNGKPCNYLARIATDDTAYQKLNLDLENADISWTIRGSGPNFHRVSFAFSQDGVNYTEIGDGAFTGPDNWFLSGDNFNQIKGNLFIRARGFVSTGAGNGSLSIYESILNVNYPENLIYLPLILK
jgi:uncharacterized delta-60 repeat protein